MLSPRTWFRPLTQQRPLEVGGENVSETQVQYSVVLVSLDRKGGWERGPGVGACSPEHVPTALFYLSVKIFLLLHLRKF